MTVQGTQLNVLQTIVDIQKTTDSEEVEDVQIAEEIDLDINLVRSALSSLAKAGHVKLEKVETLSGMVYNTFYTKQGKAALEESRRTVSKRLARLS